MPVLARAATAALLAVRLTVLLFIGFTRSDVDQGPH
jgi:hypothetical protein